MIISEIEPISEVDDATTAIGIYTWYARPSIGEADWQKSILGSDEKALDALSNLISKFSRKTTLQPLSISATANFSTNWRGDIYPNGQINKSHASEEENPRLGQNPLGATDTTRNLLVKAIETSFPFFQSPLYIGRTTDQPLRSRLQRHRDNIFKHWHKAGEDATYAERLLYKAEDFAERAISRNYTPKELYFMTLSFSDNFESRTEDHVHLTTELEWLLNRWALPILGKV